MSLNWLQRVKESLYITRDDKWCSLKTKHTWHCLNCYKLELPFGISNSITEIHCLFLLFPLFRYVFFAAPFARWCLWRNTNFSRFADSWSDCSNNRLKKQTPSRHKGCIPFFTWCYYFSFYFTPSHSPVSLKAYSLS